MPEQRLAIVGYGKMGRLIEQLAPEYGFAVALKLDEFNNADCRGPDRGELPRHRRGHRFLHSRGGARQRGRHRGAGRQPRGRHHRLAGAARRGAGARSERHGIGLVWSPNFSIGVNVFFRLVAEAARLLADEPEYGAWAWEIHHATKKDAPSGTLLKLVDEMKKAGYARTIDVGSNRAGAHPGHARDRLRFRRGHDHAAAHGAQPRRLRPRRAESRAMGGGQEGFSRVRRDSCSSRAA